MENRDAELEAKSLFTLPYEASLAAIWGPKRSQSMNGCSCTGKADISKCLIVLRGMSETNGSFRWMPGRGPDEAALERMCAAFPKPKKPTGEAWFMSAEREMYPELAGDLDALTDEQLTRPLVQIATGPPSFGQLEEWTEWYHYLLPRLLPHSWGPYLYHPAEVLITGFMSQHPDSNGRVPYPTFRADALVTLGQYIMSPQFWSDEVEVPKSFHKWTGPNGISGWYKAEGLLSASLFFCMKYLPDELVTPWFESVLSIPNRYWKAQVITWLVGAHAILSDEIGQPGEFPEEGPFGVSWDWSHVLRGNYSGNFRPPVELIPFLPAENRNAVLQVARAMEVNEFFEDFLTDPDMEAVAAETAGMPERFFELYGGSTAMR